jgi:hypothetical protein
MADGSVTVASRLITRLRSTASLKRNAEASSRIASSLASRLKSR